MKKIFLLIILLYAIGANGQNYQCLQSGVKHYFTNSYGYLRGIRIDSVRTYADSVIYYPFHTPRGNFAASYMVTLDSTGGSWLGKKVIEENDGTFLFDDLWGDTVFIKSKAEIGTSWVFFKDTSDSVYYKAQVVSTDTMTVSGALDSVKNIVLSAWVGMRQLTSDPFDSAVLLLSKNFGFIQIIDLYTFPYYNPENGAITQDYYTDASIQFPPYPIPFYALSISGINDQTNSIYRLSNYTSPSLFSLYQWHAGDVYEYSICNGLAELPTPACDPVGKFDIDSINSVDLTPVSAQYGFSGLQSELGYTFSGPTSYTTSENSGVLTYDSSRLIDTSLMPEEMGQSNTYYYISSDSSFCYVNALYGIATSNLIGAVYIQPFESPLPVQIYKSPLGLLHYYSVGIDIEYVVKDQTLIYYERGDTLCGSIYLPQTSVSPLNLPSNSFVLSPNPATTTLTITAATNIAQITLLNMLGQTISDRAYNGTSVDIDVADLVPGTYFVKINGMEVRKFLKE